MNEKEVAPVGLVAVGVAVVGVVAKQRWKSPPQVSVL